MTVIARSPQVRALDGDVDAGRDAGSDAGDGDARTGLPVVWHVTVDVPFDVAERGGSGPIAFGRLTTRRTGLTLTDAADRLRRQASRIEVAAKVLSLLDGFGGADGWQVTVSARGVRAERDDVPFENLERRLRDAGLTAADVTVGVEYARSWGML